MTMHNLHEEVYSHACVSLNTIKSCMECIVYLIMYDYRVHTCTYSTIDLLANCRVTVVGLSSLISNLLHIDNDIRLILAPKSHNALLKDLFPIMHGIKTLLVLSILVAIYSKG